MPDSKGDSEVAREQRPARAPGLLDKLEQVSRISVPVMIPLVVALVGYFGNDLLNKRQSIIEQKKVDLEYVKIAKDVVSNIKPDADARLVTWAYQTLFQLSPVKVSEQDVDSLSRRRVPLPSSTPPTILGGTSSPISDWPWLVSIYETGRFVCNGTLIGPRMVLSTAICVARGKSTNYEAATATDDGRSLRIGKRIAVTRIIMHPAFSKDTGKNDIAILELGTALPPPFATISARKSADPNVGTLAQVAALDFQSQSGSLLQTAVPIADDAACAARYGGKFEPDRTICAGFEGGGATACPGTGSAGGPLVLHGAGRKYQIGIVSMAEDCSKPGAAYGFYTRVSFYADWIRQVVPDVLSEPVTEVKR
jgi:trypsin